MKATAGLFLAFFIGIGCYLLKLPLPAPSVLLGALMVLTVTLGYQIMGLIKKK